MNRSVIAAAAALVFVTAPASAPAEDAGASWDDAMAAVLAGDHRGASRSGVPNSSRDGARNPAETLKFFGLQPDSSVVEIWPSGGWYTEIIAPFVAEKGQFYGAHFPGGTDMEFFNRARDAYKAKLEANPEVYGNAQITAMYTDMMDLAPEPVDMVLTFRNVHNWMSRDFQDEVMQAFYDVLKPGGVLGIVEHRAAPGSEQDPKAESGYVTEEYTIALAEKAGFVLDGQSEINANPRDTRDHPEGVWTLPPTLRLGDEDREKYVEIGESDR
ncbi:MAG: class I SAM-dependent methyltransferase, partial [Gammaproteobacteria bacterium]|nr:class I SAM-dependent methyltransferase [Gammaproteobacteria bacterium]